VESLESVSERGTVIWTTSTYDFIDRPSVTTNPDGSTVSNMAYSNNQRPPPMKPVKRAATRMTVTAT